jgi:hypothetical protein
MPVYRLELRNLSRHALVLAGLILPTLSSIPTRAADPPEAGALRLFRERIAPILQAECYRCHSSKAEKLQAGLRLDSRAGMLAGGDSGPAVVPGECENSPLIHAIRHEDGLAMPPKKPKLSAQTIADFEQWVRAGAPVPSESEASASVDSPLAEARRHWAFQPLRKTAPPLVRNTTWVQTPIDAFVLAKLEERDWRPAPPAQRAQWLRRLSFDLIGLPPSPQEIEAYLADPSPQACQRVVDRLLSSNRYGERWAEHWLDLVRFAETEGYEYDRHIPGAWRYRDYVIDALNRDKPFDRFLLEQIAGDEIAPADRECQIASVFHRLGPVRRNAGNPEIALSRNEVLTERTDIIGTAFLGLSVGCARCHNHKLEPISQQDYYRLQAYMAATDEHNISLAAPAVQQAWEERRDRLDKEIKQLTARRKHASGAERDRLDKEIEHLEDRLHSPPDTIPATWNDQKRRTPVHVLKRGAWEDKGEPVGPRPPSVLVPDELPELAAGVAEPRTRLARWLTEGARPLTARVFVNRIWQRHFGAGLVRTLNDFGQKGDRPSHPELLDWLATTFVEEGWRLKPLHRLIVLSSVYQQSSRSLDQPRFAGVDPENRLLWRFERRRLDAEEIRDAMLSVCGRLNSRAGGPSVIVPVDPAIVGLLAKPSQWAVTRTTSEYDRRSIYLIAKRNLRLSFLESFDAPALQASCPRRQSSTHAPQALELLNGRLASECARSFAGRLVSESAGLNERLAARAYVLALGRPPTRDERAIALEFLRDQPLEEFTLALFNLNGFLYVQ